MDISEKHQAEPMHSDRDYVFFDVMYYAGNLWRRKWHIAGAALGCAVLAYALSYTQPKLYEGTVRFMPPTRSVTTLVLSLSRSSGDEYRSMLTSETIANDVIEHQNLLAYLKARDMEEARQKLGGISKFEVDKNNFITIKVRAKAAADAVRIANEYYAALYRLTSRNTQNEAAHRLAFMAGPMQLEQQHLAEAEDKLRDAQVRTGVLLPGTQTAIGIQEVAQLRNQIVSLQAQLAAARVNATDQNPRVASLLSQIASLQGKVNSLEKKSNEANAPSRIPDAALEVKRLEREVMFHTATLEALSKSLAASSLQDNYSPTFALIDPAIPLRTKASPKRTLWAIAGFLLGLIFSLGMNLITLAKRRWLSSANGQNSAQEFGKAWSGVIPDKHGHA